MQNKFKTIKILFHFITYLLLFVVVYKYSYSYATFNFEINKIKAIHGLSYGQVYYSNNNNFYPEKMEAFLHKWGFNKEYQYFSLPIREKKIISIRLDPLSDKGEVEIKNINILISNLFDKYIKKINLNDINISTAHNIKILEKSQNKLHLITTGKDPHIVITNNINLTFHKLRDFYQILKVSLLSLFFYILFYIIYIGIKKDYLKGEEILAALILITYSIYTVFFGTQFRMAWLLIEYLPILAILIILKQNIKHYAISIKNIIIILFFLILITKSIDYIYNINTFSKYNFAIKNSIYAMIISISFIQKNKFNYIFYKYFLLLLSSIISIITIILHYQIIRIDTTLAFGFTMSMSDWAQKNYTFWYIILLFGTLSFYKIKTNKYDLLLVFLVLIISTWSIFTGYSASSKLAYIIGLIIYAIFSIYNINRKYINFIPYIIALYILLFPWLSDIFVLLSNTNARLAGRAPMFAIYSDVIKHSLLFGYGFNNTSEVDTINIVSKNLINIYKNNNFLHMCAPHSLPLLLWINFGLLGIFPFSILIYMSMKKLINNTINEFNQPALLSLISAFIVIITFSWGTWQPHALLTFAFFIGMLLLSLNIKDNHES